MKPLSKKDIAILEAFTKSARSSILQMTTQAASGHPGGSLSCIDFLAVLYTKIIAKTGEKVIVSNGHISPAVYATLAEMGYINKNDVIAGFRKIGKPYEGHVTRHVPGIWYGTGPLGAGVSAAAGFALSEKMNNTKKRVFALIGDGEAQEGQVYEMMNFAAKYKLNNFVVFMDYNKVQLTANLKEIMPFDPVAIFKAGGWRVAEIDGHNYKALWEQLQREPCKRGRPTIIIGKTIMGKGVPFMESEGKKSKSTWHGKAAQPEQITDVLRDLALSKQEEKLLTSFRKSITWKPSKPLFPKLLSKQNVKTGKPRVYTADELTDCRSAYGKALLDLAQANKNIVALTADVGGSVKTTYVHDELPKQHVEVGIAEQHMVSCSGGLSLSDIIPFCSTFGAFMTSRAKDQARVNDINHTNVKMVATHCGLSVGEDGPTHQAIDDSSSVLGFFNTMQIEPADPNQCDHMVRYIASHYGNFYMRMGRHKLPILTDAKGKVFFGPKYTYTYGKCDVLRKGKDITIVATGASVHQSLAAYEKLKTKGITAEIVIASSIKKFDATLFSSIKKTKRVLTVEDHNIHSGLGTQLAAALVEKGISMKAFEKLGVTQYQLSGTWDQLYKAAKIDSSAIVKKVTTLLKK